jgi:hypothetical protein
VPIEVLPAVYHYGYATPFYNVSHAIRCIIFFYPFSFPFVSYDPFIPFFVFFIVGLNFGVLIIWMIISCIMLPLIQWFVRRKAVIAEQGPVQQQGWCEVEEMGVRRGKFE